MGSRLWTAAAESLGECCGPRTAPNPTPLPLNTWSEETLPGMTNAEWEAAQGANPQEMGHSNLIPVEAISGSSRASSGSSATPTT